jgi:hypothetical protein
VLTDDEGLGTPGVHTYVNRKAEGYAVLGAIRAARGLPEAGLPDDGPVAIAGRRPPNFSRVTHRS